MIFFIIYHCGLVHCETPSWFISRCEYSFNTRAFSTIVEKYFNLRNKTTVQIGNDLLWKHGICVKITNMEMWKGMVP